MEVVGTGVVVMVALGQDNSSDAMQVKVLTLLEMDSENAAAVDQKSNRRSPYTSHRLNECLRKPHERSTAHETASRTIFRLVVPSLCGRAPRFYPRFVTMSS